MTRIRLLPEQVANQIAAGEVIERPASVLKELVENSLDAGATQVDVQVRAGGRNLVAVSDNGIGMGRDDALLCLERHATSKLFSSSDLDHLLSYGFRGEAIPSIASVSKFRLRTREANALAGTEIVIEGGKLLEVKEVGLAQGTQIEVRSLFYNLPARRKFLRTEATESAHLKHTLLLAGLARPGVGFTLTYDENPLQRWLAGEDLRGRLSSIFGPAWVDSTIPLEGNSDRTPRLRLRGYIGKPGISRAARGEELFFVNQRPVENRTLHFGLLEGYHNSLMKGRYPVAVLFLEMEPGGVDVNIHPAKREVRFHDDSLVRNFVVDTVQKALRAYAGAPAASFLFRAPLPDLPASAPDAVAEQTHHPVVLPHPSPPSPQKLQPVGRSLFNEESPLMAEEAVEIGRGVSKRPMESETSTAPASSQTLLPLPAFPRRSVSRPEPLLKNRLGLRIVGDLAQLYLLATGDEGLILIDQHAAHERILFEQMLRRMALQDPAAQQLLFPVTLNYGPREADFVLAQIDSLQAVGVGITRFGSTSFLVDALPAMVKPRDVGDFVRTVLSDLQQAGGETKKDRRLSEEVVAKTVCRHAVKAKDQLKPVEWDALLHDLFACDLPYTCPHGRPTMIKISLAELEKKFGRSA